MNFTQIWSDSKKVWRFFSYVENGRKIRVNFWEFSFHAYPYWFWRIGYVLSPAAAAAKGNPVIRQYGFLVAVSSCRPLSISFTQHKLLWIKKQRDIQFLVNLYTSPRKITNNNFSNDWFSFIPHSIFQFQTFFAGSTFDFIKFTKWKKWHRRRVIGRERERKKVEHLMLRRFLTSWKMCISLIVLLFYDSKKAEIEATNVAQEKRKLPDSNNMCLGQRDRLHHTGMCRYENVLNSL